MLSRTGCPSHPSLLNLCTGQHLAFSAEGGSSSTCTQKRLQVRPISLLSVVGKVFEKVVAEVVCGHLKDNVLLSNQQFGFRSGRSTSDQLMLLTRYWQDALDVGRDTVVIALDIAEAFDKVWHRGLLEKLCAKGIQGGLLQFLEPGRQKPQCNCQRANIRVPASGGISATGVNTRPTSLEHLCG